MGPKAPREELTTRDIFQLTHCRGLTRRHRYSSDMCPHRDRLRESTLQSHERQRLCTTPWRDVSKLSQPIPSYATLRRFGVCPLAAARAERVRPRAIGGNDLLIAAHALAAGTTIVTGNTDEFKRIRSLKVENWLA
jgi:hypothetical protein